MVFIIGLIANFIGLNGMRNVLLLLLYFFSLTFRFGLYDYFMLQHLVDSGVYSIDFYLRDISLHDVAEMDRVSGDN